MSDVTAVLMGARGSAAGAPAPGAAAVVAVDTLDAVADAARAAATPLLWLLDAGAEPSDATLPALLAHADAPAASLPVDDAGAAIDALVGRIADGDDDAMLAEIDRRRVPLRHAPVVSLLVDRDLVLATAPPRSARFGAYAGSEWTARLFARRTGVLVPDSRVHAAARVPADPLAALRVLRAGGWSRGDALRELRRSVARA